MTGMLRCMMAGMILLAGGAVVVMGENFCGR